MPTHAPLSFGLKPMIRERYLALLAKLHERHHEEFQEFVVGQNHKRCYFGLTSEQIFEASEHNQARQIRGSKYWTIMNTDAPTKRRFLKRALGFIGYPDEMVTHVRRLMGTP